MFLSLGRLMLHRFHESSCVSSRFLNPSGLIRSSCRESLLQGALEQGFGWGVFFFDFVIVVVLESIRGFLKSSRAQ